MLPYYERDTFFVYYSLTLQNGIVNGFTIIVYAENGSSFFEN